MARPLPTAVVVAAAIGVVVSVVVSAVASAVFVVTEGASAHVAVARQAMPVASSRLQFVTCPIVRDTKTQPCWLAEHEGELYYLGQQGGVANDFLPPQLGHQTLVEATRGQGRVCGGIQLDTVKVSVLRELTPACNTMLPVEDGIEAPPPIPAPRGPAPSWVKLDSPGEVTLYFDFDNDFFSLHVTTALTNMAQHITKTEASRVEVTGYRAATRLSSGETLTERERMGHVRAQKVADTLVGLGVPKIAVAVQAPAEAERADGVNDPWNRRVVIRVR
jgi:outer membrane protein OmpA-like peptidoglycan-associated protein